VRAIVAWFRRVFVVVPVAPPIVATGRRGRSIWDELTDQLPRPVDADFDAPFEWVTS
jgi:hypothetical protein